MVPSKELLHFYEMPFFEVPRRLIALRQVVVKQGIAYVPSSSMMLILAKKFKNDLLTSLDAAFQGLPTALSDPRVGSFLHDLQEHGMHLLVAPKPSTDAVGEKLSLDNFEELL